MHKNQIHSGVNVTLIILLEMLGIGCLWTYFNISILFKIIASFFVLWGLGYACHWIIPKITGPIIDKLYSHMEP